MIVSYEEAAQFAGEDVDPDDPDFRDSVDAADSWVKEYCGRQFDFTRHVEYIRTWGQLPGTLTGPGTSFNWVYLREYPVAQLVEIKHDPLGLFPSSIQALSLDLFYVTEFNKLVCAGYNFVPSLRGLKVTYDAGYYAADDTDVTHVPRMPADLRLAVKRIISINRATLKGPAGQGSETMAEEHFEKYSYRRDIRDSPDPYDLRITNTLDRYAAVVV